MDDEASSDDRGSTGPVVLLAGPGDTTDIVANYLAARVPRLEVIVEGAPSRTTLARRRAARIGWTAVVGQVLFVVVALPLLRRRGQRRIQAVTIERGMDATPRPVTARVDSVNGADAVALLTALRPSLVVLNGTRIVSGDVLEALGCPCINTHAGITPRYRGVHGGYWALAEGHPELVGTTVHLVDRGIDTGAVLGRAFFDVGPDDTIATYPYLHLAAGLPVLADQVRRALDGEGLTPTGEVGPPGGSHLYLHPTIWAYLFRRLVAGVR